MESGAMLSNTCNMIQFAQHSTAQHTALHCTALCCTALQQHRFRRTVPAIPHYPPLHHTARRHNMLHSRTAYHIPWHTAS